MKLEKWRVNSAAAPTVRSQRAAAAPSRPTHHNTLATLFSPAEMLQVAKRKHNRSASDAALGSASSSLVSALLASEVARPANALAGAPLPGNAVAPAAVDFDLDVDALPDRQPPAAVDSDVDGGDAPAVRHPSDVLAANRDDQDVRDNHDNGDDEDEDEDDDDARARNDEFDNFNDGMQSERDDLASDDEVERGDAVGDGQQQHATSSPEPTPAVFQLDGYAFAMQPPVLTKDAGAFRARFGAFLSILPVPLLAFFRRLNLLLGFLIIFIFTAYNLRCVCVACHLHRAPSFLLTVLTAHLFCPRLALNSYAVVDRIFCALSKVLSILHISFPTSFKQFVRITSVDQFLQSTRELIMCPKCRALFNEASCSVVHPTGRGRAPARCPVVLWGKRCDTLLVTMTKVNGVYVCNAAMSQKFTHLGIVNQLRQALTRPEICAHLFDHLQVRI